MHDDGPAFMCRVTQNRQAARVWHRREGRQTGGGCSPCTMILRARRRSYGPRRRKLARFGSCSACHPYAHLRLRAVIRWSLLSHKRRAGGMVRAAGLAYTRQGWCVPLRFYRRFHAAKWSKKSHLGRRWYRLNGTSAPFGNRTLAIRSVMRQRPRLCCGVRQWAACETVTTAAGDYRGDGHGDCRGRWTWRQPR